MDFHFPTNGVRPRHKHPHTTASDRQLDYMDALGIPYAEPISMGAAWHMIRDCVQARQAGPPTEKQESLLRSAGHWRDGLTKKTATDLIGKIIETLPARPWAPRNPQPPSLPQCGSQPPWP